MTSLGPRYNFAPGSASCLGCPDDYMRLQFCTLSRRSIWQGREALDNADEICDMIGSCCFLPQYPSASSVVLRISNKQLEIAGYIHNKLN